MGFANAQRDGGDEDGNAAEGDPSRNGEDGVAVGEFHDVFARRERDSGPQIIGADERLGFAVDGGVPVGVVVLRDDEYARARRLCFEFEVALAFVINEAFNCARIGRVGIACDAGVLFD